ncbi:SH3 domain-containing protein [Streptomyces guryensis]|uniref:SH3 domain-containing protein n=1 Tax=Streptomyces guryensis TaxID=2886947 RepID=A0A9Q3Z990_9ACTN|nr:SH3 domain-containing protein [Streptomyces guryensis]MCD9878054.1 SH3 domain-containing protein [Streptomyces guryensis]
MSLRSTLIRLATATAACALVSSVAVSPALADDEWGDGGGDHGSGQEDEHHNDRLARGVVTAETLLLRSAPNRGSQVIRVAHRGERVSIFCKTPGQSVDGDNLWYLLPDGTWAWGAARFIEVTGREPRWC